MQCNLQNIKNECKDRFQTEIHLKKNKSHSRIERIKLFDARSQQLLYKG